MRESLRHRFVMICTKLTFKGEASPSIYADWVNGGRF